MKSKITFIILLSLSPVVCLAQAQPPAVFTAEQAEQGKVFYAQDCASCHGPDLEGGNGPALTGTSFRQLMADQNRTAASLLQVISETMPYDAPGNLPDAQFDAILAYILSRSGYPAGSEKLTAENPHMAELKPGNQSQ
jgi:mono/diheme cytochrome c family protein